MDNLKEYRGVKLKGDQDIFGFGAKDGAEIRVKSVVEFEGYRCRIWAPEFHGIMMDAAIKYAKDSEKLRRSLKFEPGPIDAIPELSDSGENTANSFRVMQLAMSCLALSISSVESWANKLIHSELANEVEFERADGKSVRWGANRIEKDSTLSEKVFHVIPALMGLPPIKQHVTARKRFIELVSDRNTLVHLKNAPKVSGQESSRGSVALKLLRRNSLLIPDNVLTAVKMVYDKSKRNAPAWLAENIGALEAAKNEVKNT